MVAPITTLIKTDGRFLVVGLGIVALAVVPYWVLGPDAAVNIMDTLNINMAWYKVLADTGLQFAPPDTPIGPFMHGMPRVGFGSGWNLLLWLVTWLGPFRAYVANETLLRALAFLGMYGLITRHLLPERDGHDGQSRWIAVIAAAGFALLPFWLAGGLAVAGQPMVVLALHWLNQGRHRALSLALLALAAVHGYLAFSIFFVPAMGLYGLWIWARSRRVPVGYGLGLVIYSLMLGLVDYQFILETLHPSFVSYRSEFALAHVDWAGMEALFRSAILQGQPHAETVPMPVLLPIIAAGLIFSLFIRNLPQRIALVGLSVVFLLTCGWFAWTQSEFFHWADHWAVARQLNLSRFFILQPMVLTLAFAVALSVIARLPMHAIHRTVWIMAIGLSQIGLLLTHAVPYRAFFNLEPLHKIYGFPYHISYRQYESRALLDEVKGYIDKPLNRYRVVNVGLDPAVSQLNGLWTADGYLSYYPLSYKHAFRKVFEPELMEPWCGYCREEFDHWGSRCYILPDWHADKYIDLMNFDRFGVRKGTFPALDLSLNPDQLRALGIDYVISTVELKHFSRSGLVFLHHFDHPDSPVEIFLYGVKRADQS